MRLTGASALIFAIHCITQAASQCSSFPNAAVPAGFCATSYATGLNGARGLFLDETLSNGDLLVVVRGEDKVYSVWGSDASSRAAIASQSGLNHGVVVAPKASGSGAWLFASSSDNVYRWSYNPGGRSDLGSPTTVITGMNKNSAGNSVGGHSTRTLLFDAQGRLYVSVGSDGNVDPDSYRSRIRRFSGLTADSVGTVDFATGEVFADGLRNEVGLALDASGAAVWGVENGPDNLARSDLGSDINNDAVAEELNRFPIDSPGSFYGYPWCFSEFKLPPASSLGPGTQFSWPNMGKDDAWCRNTDNVKPPVLAMQAHSAPLGIVFYGAGWAGAQQACASCDATCSAGGTYTPGGMGAFPCNMIGDAFIAFHGSWNRSPPTGYKVVRVPFGADGLPSGPPVDFLRYDGAGDSWPSSVRPVDVVFDAKGRLFVSSDTTSEVILVSYTDTGSTGTGASPSAASPTAAPTPAPTSAPAPTPAPTTAPGTTPCCPGVDTTAGGGDGGGGDGGAVDGGAGDQDSGASGSLARSERAFWASAAAAAAVAVAAALV